MKLELKYPATAENAADHARLAVHLAREEFEEHLDFSPQSLEAVDAHIGQLRELGLTGEEAAETLFVFGCYVGEVMALELGGSWVATARSRLADVSPWPMVVQLRDGSAWDAIGKVYKRLELGDAEYLPAFFAAAAVRGRGPGDGVTQKARPDSELGEPFDPPESIELPITGELDLHAFAPRDVPQVVADYIDACLERSIHELRIVHGRGKGVQRAVVRRLLARHPAVAGFEEAPPGSGGWGAVLVRLAPANSPSKGEPRP